MKIKIQKIEGQGVLDEERVVLKASEDHEVGSYVLFKTKRLSGKQISSHLTLSFWFPDQQVEKNDLIVIYTKKGISSVTENKNGTHTYFFHYGSTEPIWSQEDDCAVIAELATWGTKSVKESKGAGGE